MMEERPKVVANKVRKDADGGVAAGDGHKAKKESDVHGKGKKEVDLVQKVKAKKVADATSSKKLEAMKKEKEGSSSKPFYAKVTKKEEVKCVKEERLISNGKTTVKKKTLTKTLKSTGVDKEKEKKVYCLPGQKHDPPEERDPLRIFYESLYEQIPTSEMAEGWLMEHGLLPEDAAKRAYERKQKRSQQQKTGTPSKPLISKDSSRRNEKKAVPNGRDEVKSTGPKTKREAVSDDDEDFKAKPKKKLKLEN